MPDLDKALPVQCLESGSLLEDSLVAAHTSRGGQNNKISPDQGDISTVVHSR